MDAGSGTRWAFRVASRPEDGGGHVARCLTLADALAALGHHVTFVLDDAGMHWKAHIAGRGHGCGSVSATLREAADGSLLDGYNFADTEIYAWRECSGVMVAMIDHQDVPRWADLVVAPGLPAGRSPVSAARILAGLDYALIDPRLIGAEPRTIPENVKNVLVSFGQRDSKNATGLVLDALEHAAGLRPAGAAITIALGGLAVHRAAVESRARGQAGVSFQADADMIKCYAQADLVIGGGGLGLLERMAAGLPSISIVLADNQQRQIEVCAAAGGTLNMGPIGDVDVKTLADAVDTLARSAARRAAMSAAARRAVDGAGARRVAKAMVEYLHVH